MSINRFDSAGSSRGGAGLRGMGPMIPGRLAAWEGVGKCRQNRGCSAPAKILRVPARPIHVDQLHLADLDPLRGAEKLRRIAQCQRCGCSIEYTVDELETVRLIHRIFNCAEIFSSLALFQKFVAREGLSRVRVRSGEDGRDA